MNDIDFLFDMVDSAPTAAALEGLRKDVEKTGGAVKLRYAQRMAELSAPSPAPAPVAATAPAPAPARTPAPTPAPAPLDKAAIRTLLSALIASAKDIDDLTGPVAKEIELQTRAGELFIIRGEMKEAIKAKAREFGRKLTAPELRTMLPEGKKVAGSKAAATMDFTEAGITERLRRKHGDELMYTADSKHWYLFDGNVWKQEPSPVRVVQLAREIVAGDLPKEACYILDPELHDEAMKDIKSLQRVNVAKCAVEGLAGEHGILTDSEALNTHPELLAVANGMVDLRTGKLLAADPEARLTMAAPAAYNPEAKCPVFLQTLSEAMRGDQELVDFIQRLMGYSIMATPKERVLVVPIGGGKNGKSTIFNAIQETLGTHAGTMGSETIACAPNAPMADGAGPREDLLRLRGKRTIFASEIKRSTVFVDNTVKTLAGGGDTITCRGLNKPFVEFKPTCVVIAPTNVLPIVREDDPAVWDRLVLLPFLARFDLDKGVTPDLERPAKLKAEQEGILAWLVQGALEYQRGGLRIPKQIHDLKARNRDGASPISMFLEDHCIIDKDALESTDALFAAWRLCAMEQGEKFTASTKIGFARTLASHGFEGLRIRHGKERIRGFKGLRLKDAKTRYQPEQLTLGN